LGDFLEKVVSPIDITPNPSFKAGVRDKLAADAA
jgi:hypothetical protein